MNSAYTSGWFSGSSTMSRTVLRASDASIAQSSKRLDVVRN
jgi:hypothetical protein